ncbi:TIGR03618 family F420-dependent PPOX class oxidoreductase [Protofrankia symbiont of Coriaria ruscifolia]|uniref:Putative F420-dependent protein n=1 Tax=Candidatus Protofrankia californiensis TaxID=1839754 RepID=A0A1C3NTV8_9ACTN|nr:TIGR03618 family F420-dependent PPOX class oxidoreductase [Protofrankia symbiont of Coriaria ruscifolia]SBW18161.1 putative F420-dependent protein [Candidatus Protofrankia californiensis]
MTDQATTEHAGEEGTPALPVSARRLFASDREATIVTIDPDGAPQASLVWMAFDGGDLVFGVEEHRRKVRNLRRDPRVTVVVHDDERTADGVADGLVQYLTVRGRATLLGQGSRTSSPRSWTPSLGATSALTSTPSGTAAPKRG